MKVLVVDDDETLRDVTRLMLRHLKHECLTASDGEEAEALALTEKPDLILLDVLLPYQDGYVTLQHLRERGYQGDVVMTSALLAQVVERKLAAMNLTAPYFGKPFGVRNLSVLLDAHCP